MLSRVDHSAPELSLIAPAHNEQDNVDALVREIVEALRSAGRAYEIIIVDDGSTDETLGRLRGLRDEHPQLRILHLPQRPDGTGAGQSAAFHAGFRAARGDLIATLDADSQNDPADLPRLLAIMREHDVDVVQGNRKHSRADGAVRSFSAWVGWLFRRTLLGDTIVDTGCSLRVMRREVALRLPLEFRGMHRFIPITARHLGYSVLEVPVSHRKRTSGLPKYGMWDRAIAGLVDCFAVCWMRSRRRSVEFLEIEVEEHASQSPEVLADCREVYEHEVMR